MTSSQRSGFDPPTQPDWLSARVGEIGGQLTALEARVGRHETEVKMTLNEMNLKFDIVGTKLDDIKIALAKQSGGVAWVSTLGKWALWLIGGAASAAAIVKTLIPWGHT